MLFHFQQVSTTPPGNSRQTYADATPIPSNQTSFDFYIETSPVVYRVYTLTGYMLFVIEKIKRYQTVGGMNETVVKGSLATG